MKKLISLLLAALTVLAPLGSLAETQYYNVSELREQTPAYWTESYQTKWRTIEIDAPIEMPQVEAFPILKISTNVATVAQDKLAAYRHIVYNDADWFEAYTAKALTKEFEETPSQRRKIAAEFAQGEIPNVQPEDVTISYDEALAFCYAEINRFWGLDASQVALKSTTAYDGVYAVRRQNGQKIWGKRVDNRTGFWSFYFERLYHGIPVEPCDNGNTYDDYFSIRGASTPRISICVWSKDIYYIDANIHAEIETVYADVPLKSFADAKAAIEQEILAGHLRSIGKVKLCYIPYTDPSDKSVFWLLPTWYVEGIYTGSAKKDLLPVYDDETGLLVGYEGGVNDNMVVAYDANHGRLIDRKDTGNKRRNVSEIITWSTLDK